MMKRVSLFIFALCTLLTTIPMIAADDLMTPERLWAMGRMGSVSAAPNGREVVYSVSYYSKEKNNHRTALYLLDTSDRTTTLLTAEGQSESGATYLNDGRIAFMKGGELWIMDGDGKNRQQLTQTEGEVGDYLFSPDGQYVVLVMEVEQHHSIAKNDDDLPKATGMVINDLMYKHWDHYVKTAPHPFLYKVEKGSNGSSGSNGSRAVRVCDILEGEPYECPMEPFGGVEQLAWSPDSKQLAYTCRKKVGREYAISTDSDIFLYDLVSRKTTNICKEYSRTNRMAVHTDYTRTLADQPANLGAVAFSGYDDNPAFSPDGRYIAFRSMERDGYESDRTRLVIFDTQATTAESRFRLVSEDLGEGRQSGVEDFCWSTDGSRLFFTAVWHGRTNIYATNLQGQVQQLTDDVCDYVLRGVSPDGRYLWAKRHSISQGDELYRLPLYASKRSRGKAPMLLPRLTAEQMTTVNKETYDQLTFGEVKECWTTTTDGKQMLSWVIYPPHFDPSKKYPTLLFCEGGPQSPVSQFWSYRWNFQIMAANGYIIIAPNRRGLPGFGMEWLEQISGDYTGQCMQDYLSAIDDIAQEPYVDRDRMGAVGASFGGFSVYWLAGHHDGRFKAFIAHDGIYNTQQQYVETEELWFPNWDMGCAPWYKNAEGQMQKVFEQSPHLYVQNWDTPILCIHGQKDFRIEYTQAESAFTAARLRGIDAQLLLFPDENHWVLHPQNGILWQRTFFRFLEKNLKK